MFKKLFCKHNFVERDTIPCTLKYEDGHIEDVPITLLECSKCGKRITLKDYDIYYNKTLLQKVKLWEKGLYNWESYSPKLFDKNIEEL